MILTATQIYGSHGGIPSYMRRLSEVLSTICQEGGTKFSAASLVDSTWDASRHVKPVVYDRFIGSGGHRGRFLCDLTRLAAARRGETMIVGHVALAPIAYALRRLKLIADYFVVLHGIEAWRPLRRRERIACAGARMVATTNYTRERFSNENAISKDRIVVVPLALGKSELDPVRPENRETLDDPVRVLFVGRLSSLERYKGADELIEAIALLKDARQKTVLDIIGTGDDLPRLQQKAQNAGVDGSVCFHGALTDSALNIALQNCHIFALPSSGEGFGIAFLEAMSYAKPCLGADCGGIPEVIAAGVDGFLVPYGSAPQIADRIRLLKNDRKLRSMLGANGYQKVARGYLLGNLLANWRNLLASAA